MKTYTLLDRNGKPYQSPNKGLLGGHRKQRMYGRLDCENALRWIAKGHYVKERVFFADESTAIAAGYRPCGICMKSEYDRWQARQNSESSIAAYKRAEAVGLELLEREVAARSELARNVGMLLVRIATYGKNEFTESSAKGVESFDERRQQLQDQIADVIEAQPDLDPVIGIRVLFEMALLYVEQIHDHIASPV